MANNNETTIDNPFSAADNSKKKEKAPQQPNYAELVKVDNVQPDYAELVKVDKGVGGHLKDSGASLAAGIASIPDMAIGIGDMYSGGRAGKAIEDSGIYTPGFGSDYWRDQKTINAKAQDQQRQAADGIIDKAKVVLSNPTQITNAIGESLAPMVAGGLVGRGINIASKGKIGAAAAGAIGEGVVMGGSQAESIRQQTDDGLLTGGQVGAAVATGVAGSAFSYLSGRIAQELGFDDIDNMIANGVRSDAVQEAAKNIPITSIPKKILQGAISEGILEELPQSVSEQALQNIALGKPWHENLDDAAVMGTLAGMAMGGGINAYTSTSRYMGQERNQDNDGTQQADINPDVPMLPGGSNALDGEFIPNDRGQATTDAQGRTTYEYDQFSTDADNLLGQGAGFNPMQGNSPENPDSPIAPTTPPLSRQLGINPEDGPLSGAAALAVDSGATASMLNAPNDATKNDVEENPNTPLSNAVPSNYQSLLGDNNEPFTPPNNTEQGPTLNPTSTTPATGMGSPTSGDIKSSSLSDNIMDSTSDQQEGSLGVTPGNDEGLQPKARIGTSDNANAGGINLDAAQNGKTNPPSINTSTDNAITSTLQGESGRSVDLATNNLQAEPIIGADGQNKWFASQDKANAFIEKKNLGNDYQVVQNDKRFEIQPKAKSQDSSIQTSQEKSKLAELEHQLATEKSVPKKAQIRNQIAELQNGLNDQAQSEANLITPQKATVENHRENFAKMDQAVAKINTVRQRMRAENPEIFTEENDRVRETHGLTNARVSAIADEIESSGSYELSDREYDKVKNNPNYKIDYNPKTFTGKVTAVKDQHSGEWIGLSEPNNSATPPTLPNLGGVEEIQALEQQLAVEKSVIKKVRLRKQIADLQKNNPVDQAAHAAATSIQNDLPEPTQAQIEAGNYKKGHIKVHGLDIAVENPRGSERRGTDPDGNEWVHTMSDHYGYIKRTVGADQENIATYVGKNHDSDKVYVVDQIDQGTGGFDEHKVMLGFDSQDEAVAAYQSNFDKGWKVGAVNEMTRDQFKDWLKNSDTSKAVSEQSSKAEQPKVEANEQRESKIQSFINKWNQLKENGTASELDNFHKTVKIALNGYAQGKGVVAEFEQLKADIENFAKDYNKLPKTEQSTNTGPSAAETSTEQITTEIDSEATKTEATQKPKVEVSENRLVSDDRAAELRARLKAKLSQLNSGIDPEIMAIGAELAVYHIERGARKFAAFAKNIAADLDVSVEKIRPYLRSWYNGARDMMEDMGADIQGMDSADTVRAELAKLDNPQQQSNAIQGKTETVVTPSGREFEVQHKVVEADDLITSNLDSGAVNTEYPQALQPRDRTTLKSVTQINDIANKLNPKLLGDSASSTNGAPIVSSDNEVESGNGRTLAIRKAYQTGKADAYKAWLAEQGYDVANMQQPILVRERTTPMNMAERVAYTTESNERDTLDMSPSEQAMSDAPKVMDILHLVQGGSFNNTANRDFVNAFLTGVASKNERGTMLDKDGVSLTQDGYRRIEASLLAAAFNDDQIINSVIESKDSDIKAIGNALLEVAPRWAEIKKGVQDGILVEGVDVSANLVEAVHLVQKARQQNLALSEMLNQDDIFEGGIDQITKDFISILYSGDKLNKARSKDKVVEALNAYAQLAMTAKASPNLFGDAPLSNQQILGTVNDKLKQSEAEKQQDFFSSQGTNDTNAGKSSQVGQGSKSQSANAGTSKNQTGLNNNEQSTSNSSDPKGTPAVRSGGSTTQQGNSQTNPSNVETGVPTGNATTGTAQDSERPSIRGTGKNVANNGAAGTVGNESNGRKGTSGAATLPIEQPTKLESNAALTSTAQDFHMTDPDLIFGGGQKQRFDKNKAAIELLDELTTEGRQATPEEQIVLASYTGWGSFGQDLFQGTWNTPIFKDGWKDQNTWLRENLGKESWESAKDSILNAFFTDPYTVQAMWSMAEKMGFTGGRVLEPAVGTGNFISLMPQSIKARSQVTAIDLDITTASISKQLFPESNVQNIPYQKSKTPDNFYDLVITNVPFSNDVKIADRRYNQFNPNLHDYFFLKALDQVRPGGIVMAITSSGTMDKQSEVIRRELAKQAELITSVRLPSGAFKEFAGTAVVTDIIVLRKRAEPLAMTPDTDWIGLSEVQTSTKPVKVNAFYANNLRNVLGTIDYKGGDPRFSGMTVKSNGESWLKNELNNLADLVDENTLLPRSNNDVLGRVQKLLKDQANNFSIEVDGVKYDKHKEADEAIKEFAAENIRLGSQKIKFAKYAGTPLSVQWKDSDTQYTLSVQVGPIEYSAHTLRGLESKLRSAAQAVEDIEQDKANAEETINGLSKAVNQPFGQAEQLQRTQKKLASIESDLENNPVAPPIWLRRGTPVDAEVYYKGKLFIVSGHRYTNDGWFVSADDAKGTIEIPYMEATDSIGMPVYEEREFEAPNIEDKTQKEGEQAAAPNDQTESKKDEPLYSRQSGNPKTGKTTDQVRDALIKRFGKDTIEALEKSGKLRIAQSYEVEGVEGFYHNGRVTLIADNLNDDSIIPTFLHELGGHGGFQNMMSKAKYAELMAMFNDMVKRGHPMATAAKELAEREAGTDRQQLEYLPYLLTLASTMQTTNALQRNAVQRFIDRMVSAVKAWAFDQLGVNINLTPNDMVALAERMVNQSANNEQENSTDPDVLFSRQSANMQAMLKGIVSNLNKQGAGKLKQQASFKFDHALGYLLQGLGRRQLTEVYAKLLPQLEKYNNLAAQMDADKNEAGARADEIVVKWAKVKDEQQLAELMHEATLAKIDPDKPYVSGDSVSKYKQLRNDFRSLSPEAQSMYRQARDEYKKHHRDVLTAIKERIMRASIGNTKKAELMKQMDDNFFHGLKGVYFPLSRFGQYVILVRDKNGVVESVNRAETRSEAEALHADLVKMFPNSKVEKVIRDKAFNASRDMVGRGFMTDLFDELDKFGLSATKQAELEDILGQLYLSSLPDLSWAKHGIHRKGTAGFSQNARRAFAQNMFHGASYLVKLRYADEMVEQLDEMQKYADQRKNDNSYDQPVAQAVIDEMNKRHESLMSPDSNPLSSALTSLGFIYFLGLSVASGAVNLLQTVLVAYPQMGAKWGFDKAFAELNKAGLQSIKGGNDISKSLQGDELKAYNEAVRRGVIDVTQAHDLAGIAQGEDSGVMWKLRPIMRWASFIFHQAERFNREVTFVASYRLAKGKGVSHDVAFEQAMKATYDGHFDYSSGNRPRVMQGNVQKVLFLFKQFGQNMLYTMLRSLHQTFKAETPAARKEAFRALTGIMGAHAVFAGTLGLPLISTLLGIISFFGGGDDEPWDAETALKNNLADVLGVTATDVLMNGVSRVTPWDISGRVSINNLIVPKMREGLEGESKAQAYMSAAIGPIGGIFINILKGFSEIADGHGMRGVETMSPTFLRGPLRAIRFADEGAQDKTGVSIQDDVGIAAILGQAAGFAPSDVRLATEGRSAVYDLQKKLDSRRSSLMTKFARAELDDDQETMDEAWQEIQAFNEANPSRRINKVQAMQSYKKRKKRIDNAEHGMVVTRKKREDLDEGRFAYQD